MNLMSVFSLDQVPETNTESVHATNDSSPTDVYESMFDPKFLPGKSGGRTVRNWQTCPTEGKYRFWPGVMVTLDPKFVEFSRDGYLQGWG